MAFKFVNVNPNGANTDDCVTRAISLVSGLDYFEVQEKLVLTSKLFGCDRLSKCCYSNLLEKVFDYTPVFCKGMTLEEFCIENPFGIFLIRLPNHLTAVIDGEVNDTWDCSNLPCDQAWFVCE